MTHNPSSQDVDWPSLRSHALAAMRQAYAPYSQFPVGAAALVDDGRIVVGCNVENAGYGVTLCAECGLISALVIGGPGKLVAFTCVDAQGTVIMPCGRCRQLLWEHGGALMLMETPGGVFPLEAMLPYAFGPDNLDKVAQAATTTDTGIGHTTH